MEFVVKTASAGVVRAAVPPTTSASAAFKKPKENHDDGARRRNPLVIPLASKTEDEEAALAVIADASSSSAAKTSSSSTLVIGSVSTDEESREKKKAANVPLLVAGRLPGLEEVRDESEKFRKDLSMRAEDVAASSQSYERVPIEEFGAAVLRGMGWSGPTKEDDERFSDGVKPRYFRLGLGAEKKPEEIFDKRGKLIDGKKRKWLGATQDEAARLATIRRRKFAEGEVVRIRQTKSQRARIVELRDGETEALVEFEKTGEREMKPLDHLDRVSTQSLLAEPFWESKKKHSDTNLTSKKRKTNGDSSESGRERNKPRADWLCSGIRVRVVRRGDPLYRQKAKVIDVIRKDADGPLRGVLLLDLTGNVVHDPGIREKHLETALPKDGGRIKAVFGKHKGRAGHLVRREKQRQTVLLTFDDQPDDILEVAMDDVAELCDDDDGFDHR